MSMTLEEIEAEALALPETSRAKLFERLLQSFEEELEEHKETAMVWAEEAERRDRKMAEKNDSGSTADAVFKRLRASSK